MQDRSQAPIQGSKHPSLTSCHVDRIPNDMRRQRSQSVGTMWRAERWCICDALKRPIAATAAAAAAADVGASCRPCHFCIWHDRCRCECMLPTVTLLVFSFHVKCRGCSCLLAVAVRELAWQCLGCEDPVGRDASAGDKGEQINFLHVCKHAHVYSASCSDYPAAAILLYGCKRADICNTLISFCVHQSCLHQREVLAHAAAACN